VEGSADAAAAADACPAGVACTDGDRASGGVVAGPSGGCTAAETVEGGLDKGIAVAKAAAAADDAGCGAAVGSSVQGMGSRH
jgi:hypothetical protein